MEPKYLVLIVALALLVGAAAADDQIQSLDGCKSACGDVQISYPFGVGNSSKTGQKCFLEEQLDPEPFEVACNGSTLLWGNIPVIAINTSQGQVDMMIRVSKICYDISSGSDRTESTLHRLCTVPGFTISSEDNKFISVGCDTFGYLNSFYDDTEYSTGCLSRCYGNTLKNVDGNCSGIGCCQVDIPPWMTNISTQAYSFENFNSSLTFNNCSYSFVVKNGNYTFSKDHLENLPYKRMPVVFDWTVGNETCEDSRKRGTYACKGNSTCVDSNTGSGYQCQCNEGYEGNPYHPNGCKVGHPPAARPPPAVIRCSNVRSAQPSLQPRSSLPSDLCSRAVLRPAISAAAQFSAQPSQPRMFATLSAALDSQLLPSSATCASTTKRISLAEKMKKEQ